MTDSGWRVYGETLEVETQGFSDIVDLTEGVSRVVSASGVRSGQVSVTVLGSTASVSTIEFEPALVEDMRELLEEMVSSRRRSRHSETWGDDNGFSHMRATLMGPGITLPVEEGAPMTGTWQQVVVIDHDNRPRRRRVRVQVCGLT
jgi:secondary thiamine-phosphate synthase enzyme